MNYLKLFLIVVGVPFFWWGSLDFMGTMAGLFESGIFDVRRWQLFLWIAAVAVWVFGNRWNGDLKSALKGLVDLKDWVLRQNEHHPEMWWLTRYSGNFRWTTGGNPPLYPILEDHFQQWKSEMISQGFGPRKRDFPRPEDEWKFYVSLIADETLHSKRATFYDLIESKTVQSKWAASLGITNDELASLMEEATEAGWMRKREDGKFFRVPSAKRPPRPVSLDKALARMGVAGQPVDIADEARTAIEEAETAVKALGLDNEDELDTEDGGSDDISKISAKINLLIKLYDLEDHLAGQTSRQKLAAIAENVGIEIPEHVFDAGPDAIRKAILDEVRARAPRAATRKAPSDSQPVCQGRSEWEPVRRSKREPLAVAGGEARRPPRGGLRAFRVGV